MAKSAAHRVGQIIGYALETSLLPLLADVATEHGLYLDKIGPRRARGGRRLLTWRDHSGNSHNLDFVLEAGGSAAQTGAPCAFIEVAWRRYTKHSVNKAGEISNALVPLRNTYSNTRPFTGAVVAGAWTQGGLAHMTSQGITVLFIPLDEIVSAFANYGIDMDLGEDTPEEYQEDQIDAWDALSAETQLALSLTLPMQSPERYADFRRQIDQHLRRRIERVLVLPLHGQTLDFDTCAQAIAALSAYPTEPGAFPVHRVEVQIRYSNGDTIDANFSEFAEAIAFLAAQK